MLTTNKSSEAEKLKHKAWDRSTILCLGFSQMTVANNNKSMISGSVTTKKYFNLVEECFCFADKSLGGILMIELTTMKYDGLQVCNISLIWLILQQDLRPWKWLWMTDSFLIQSFWNHCLGVWAFSNLIIIISDKLI